MVEVTTAAPVVTTDTVDVGVVIDQRTVQAVLPDGNFGRVTTARPGESAR
jgi:hypothetical protein